MLANKPILLCILDGFGIGDENDKNNAIARANLKHYPKILQNFPNCQLKTSGLDVGLPCGQIGNSEVGHITIGAGRLIYQDLPRINKAIENDDFPDYKIIQNLIYDLKKTKKAAHIMGLLSSGGVHCHQNHIIYFANLIAKENIEVFLHIFLDGRDVEQKSALEFIMDFESKTGKNVKIATVSGRYFAMDRDKKWDRIKKVYDVMFDGFATDFSALKIVENNYKKNITDEFIEPCATADYMLPKDGDALISLNFRADRIRQISQAILIDNFKEFERKKINFSHKISLTEYSKELADEYEVLFKPEIIKNSLPEILEKNNVRQLRIAETEKYAHITFFFSCGREKEFEGEKRILIQSPSVATYDLQPEMSARKITDEIVKKIDEFDFIIVNYANADMVGHSGNLSASIKACQALDEELEILKNLILEKNGVMIITADHGNIESMRDAKNNPHTAHTTNPVPFILIKNDVANIKLKNGALDNIAPTILDLIGLDKPKEMTSDSLII